MFAFCRTKPIRSIQYLTAQTRHARREDQTSKDRVRADAEPGASLSWSCDDGPKPDYSASFKAFKRDKAAAERKGAQLGLHMLVGVSPEWVKEAGDLHDPSNPRNRQLLDAARAWADTWSNGGCYAARVDLDETGGAVVDLFIAPTAIQKHKGGKSKLTVSVNKALEAVSTAQTGRKSQHFSALNSDWAEYAAQHLDPRLQRGRSKAETRAEHVQPDRYRSMMEAAEKTRDEALVALSEAQIELKAARLEVEVLQDRAASVVEDAARRGVEAGAEALSMMLRGDLVREDGRWKPRVTPSPAVREVWKAIAPALTRIWDWWAGVRDQVKIQTSPPEDPRQDTSGPSL